MNPWPFIAGAYGVTILGVAALGLAALWRQARARARLAALESQGPRRRRTAGGAPA